jgi:GMP synthase (glutamine-hydrolysing)
LQVDLTVNGKQVFSNFLFNVAGYSPSYTMEDREDKAIREIRDAVGEDKKVLVLVSGGVDSSVCAALVSKAIGPDRIYAIHIDHGLMRKNESSSVEKALGALGLRLKVIYSPSLI